MKRSSLLVIGVLCASAVVLAWIGLKPFLTPRPAAPPTASRELSLKEYEALSLEDKIVLPGVKAGKAAWDVDCDRAFLGNLEAARRVKRAVQGMPYGQRSERSDICAVIEDNTIKMGGIKP